MDVNAIRSDFDIFNQKINGKPIIYFDNACQTLRPRPVIEAIQKYYTDYPACAGRSAHKLGTRVTQAVDKNRHLVAKFIGAKASEIIFTRNTTEGINLIAHGLDLNEGDEVIISDKEHNSNLIPWLRLSETKKINVKITPTKEDNTFDLEAFKNNLTSKTKLVSLVMTSNLDGITNPVKEIIKLAHQHKSLVLLDGAQAMPHMKVDVKKLNVDFLAFSGHKMLGPSGIGILYGKTKLLESLAPFMLGGDTVSSSTYDSYELLPLPEKYEAGLQNYAGIIGLGAAIEYLSQIGLDKIKAHETYLNQLISQELADINSLHLVGPQDPALRGGIFSFYVDGWSHHQLAVILDELENIAVRSGQHCVHSWFNGHNLTGTIRASFYLYNTKEEVEKLTSTLKKILK